MQPLSVRRRPTPCLPSLSPQYVDLSAHELYPDQAVLLTRTGVLVGMHGAALNNMMWMRPMRGAVVEHARGKSRYGPMARSLGHFYSLAQRSPVAMAVAAVRAMDHVTSLYCRLQRAPSAVARAAGQASRPPRWGTVPTGAATRAYDRRARPSCRTVPGRSQACPPPGRPRIFTFAPLRFAGPPSGVHAWRPPYGVGQALTHSAPSFPQGGSSPFVSLLRALNPLGS